MLALTRKTVEKIVIGDNVVLTIVDIRGDNVRVAIEAPKQVKIYRGELYEAIAKENIEAAGVPSIDNLSLFKQIQGRK